MVLLYKQQTKNQKKETLLTCLADLFYSVAIQKRKTGSIAPKKFIQRLRKENCKFWSMPLGIGTEKFPISVKNSNYLTIFSDHILLHFCQKHVAFLILVTFLQILTSLCNIWPTVYWVNLQHDSYWFTHLTYVLLLHYLGEMSQLHSNNCSNISCTLPLHKLTMFSYPHKMSALEPKYHSKCSKLLPFSSTQAWSLSCHLLIAPYIMLCDKLFQVSIKALPQVCHASN